MKVMAMCVVMPMSRAFGGKKSGVKQPRASGDVEEKAKTKKDRARGLGNVVHCNDHRECSS